MGDWWYYITTMTFKEITERIKRVNDLQIRHPPGFVTISQGVAAVIPSDDIASQNLLLMAEETVACAQKAGGNQVHFASHKNNKG